ncbi:sulfite exporter TauE/SafE family protein [Salibacterium salarium]|uniref:Probable membrane transporter protein n=1 Tax=Salibacterium salarium TaxID=284579 RepID=A0A3R9P4W4_9BACI|nr:sulfite exporter TauE/SafE family protein [Salibacterium salarium]RSL30351.1 sulfite exporter TauE/SafE family protein [Salibacterium salarium]
MEWVVLAVTGLLAGTLGSLMGLGGGIIIVPALMIFSGFSAFFADISPQTAVGTSLLIMIFTGLSSTLAYMKQKTVDYLAGAIFIIGGGPGALFGVWLNKDIEAAPFLIFLGLFMVFVSFILLIRHKLKPLKIRGKGIRRTYIDAKEQEVEYGFQPVIAIVIAFAVGMLSGLFGIGGGSLMVPVMILLFGFPPHLAVATSMFMVLLSALISSVSHIALGNVEWLFALALIPGAWIGAKIGAAINRRLKSDTLVILLRIFLIIIGIRLMWQGFSGL